MIPAPIHETCSVCKFWRVSDGPTWGKCVAHPPALSSISPGKMLALEHPTSLFPVCHKDVWCGEFKRV